MVILLSKYDARWKKHVTECVEKSRKNHQAGLFDKSGHTKRGGGSLVTFLSKTTVNSIINTIQHLIQDSIAKEVREAGMFSVQIDTTQDITSQDQCSIIRYVTDVIHERLVAVVNCEASTGEYFVGVLTKIIEQSK